MNSVHGKIDKVRKSRVQISYDLEDGGKTVKQELPFVVGVMGDYSGHSASAKIPLKDRKFIQIDGENFDGVMSKIEPELNLKVDNKLANDDSQLAVDLKFNSMEDFEPESIAKQVPALNRLLEVRAELRDLLSKADRSEDLEGLLEKIIQDEEQLKNLAGELGADESAEPKTEEKGEGDE